MWPRLESDTNPTVSRHVTTYVNTYLRTHIVEKLCWSEKLRTFLPGGCPLDIPILIGIVEMFDGVLEERFDAIY